MSPPLSVVSSGYILMGEEPPYPHHKRKSLSTGSIYKRDVLYGVDDSLATLNQSHLLFPPYAAYHYGR